MEKWLENGLHCLRQVPLIAKLLSERLWANFGVSYKKTVIHRDEGTICATKLSIIQSMVIPLHAVLSE